MLKKINNASLLGGVDAEKQLKIAIYSHFLKSNMATIAEINI